MRERHVHWDEILRALEEPEALHASARAHLDDCPQCRELEEDARELLGLLSDARLPVPPSALVARTMARIADHLADPAGKRKSQPAGALSGLVERLRATMREIWATQVADSRVPDPALRGATLSSPRMLRYETPGYLVTLSLMPGKSETVRDVMGQLVPRQDSMLPSGTHVAVASGEGLIEAPLTETGEFRLRSVGSDIDEIGIIAGDDWIRLRIPTE